MKAHFNHLILTFLTSALILSCEEPIDTKSIAFDDLLVVEGMITDRLDSQVIKLTRTYSLDDNEPMPETGAEVWVETEEEGIFTFTEVSPGIYKSAPFSATFATSYQLQITTLEGKNYSSEKVTMMATPEIDTIYAEYIEENQQGVRGEGYFAFYLSINENETTTGNIRMQWEETYKIKVPNPSRWRWLGGDLFEFRDEAIPEMQQEYCYREEKSNKILLAKSDLSSGDILEYPIRRFETISRRLFIRYAIEVTAYGLSGRSNEYWKAIASTSQDQGSLFDEQPGTITGNMKSTSDPEEIVLGIFEVAQKKTKRVFFRPSDFYHYGYALATNDWVQCQSEPVLIPFDEAGAYMQENYQTHELLYYATGIGGLFGIKSCALCTLYGTNKKPEFWID